MEDVFEANAGDEDFFDDHRNILYPEKIENLTEEEKLEGETLVKYSLRSAGAYRP